jgi:hypothetical protein
MAHGGDMAMLDRIVVHLVHVPCIVGIVANHMLPAAALSDAPLATGDTGPGTPRGRRHGAREAETVDIVVRGGWRTASRSALPRLDAIAGRESVHVTGSDLHLIGRGIGGLDADHAQVFIVAEVGHGAGLLNPRIPDHG